MAYDGIEDKVGYDKGISIGSINKCRHNNLLLQPKVPDGDDFDIKDTYDTICKSCGKVLDEDDS